MNIEIPAELLLPTVEELEERTARDLDTKWNPHKRLGKRERIAMKKEQEAIKLKAISEKFDKPQQTTVNSLSSLFTQSEKTAFSLSAANAKSAENPARPTLRVSLSNPSKPATPVIAKKRKIGRPPKVKPL